MSIRKRIERLERIIEAQKTLFHCLFETVDELIDRVKALEKGKHCECKKESEDGIKDNNR